MVSPMPAALAALPSPSPCQCYAKIFVKKNAHSAFSARERIAQQ